MLAVVEEAVAGSCVVGVGLLYPAYESFKALHSQGDTKQWLTYWVCFSVWKMVNATSSATISAHPLRLTHCATCRSRSSWASSRCSARHTSLSSTCSSVPLSCTWHCQRSAFPAHSITVRRAHLIICPARPASDRSGQPALQARRRTDPQATRDKD